MEKVKDRMEKAQAAIIKARQDLEDAQIENAFAAVEYRMAHEYLVDLENAVNE